MSSLFFTEKHRVDGKIKDVVMFVHKLDGSSAIRQATEEDISKNKKAYNEFMGIVEEEPKLEEAPKEESDEKETA